MAVTCVSKPALCLQTAVPWRNIYDINHEEFVLYVCLFVLTATLLLPQKIY